MSTNKIPPSDYGSSGANDSLANALTGNESSAELEVLLQKNKVEQETGDLLRAKLVGETARAPWHELQRFFAQGTLLMAAQGIDMIDVAVALANDDRDAFAAWLQAEQAGPVSDAQALAWSEADATLWTVVVRPWVLVQEVVAA